MTAPTSTDASRQAAEDAELAKLDEIRDKARSRQVMEASRQFAIAADRLPTLYSLAAEWTELLWLLEDPETDAEAIELELRRVASDIKQKGYGLAVVMQGLKGLAERQKAEAQRMAAKAKANEAHYDRMAQYALECMQAIGEERIETGIFTLSVRENPEHVAVLDRSLIPTDFWRYKPAPAPEPDLNMIKASAKAGLVVPGTALERTKKFVIS